MNEARLEGASHSPEALIQLIEAVARNQDQDAFAQLFAYFAPRVKSFLMRSGMADTVAEEVTQEAMIALWRKASYFDPSRAGASTWVFTIARNLRIDRLRRTYAGSTERLFNPFDEPATPLSAEDVAITAEREKEIRNALGTLSSEQATIVRLSYFAEKPHTEISRELGIPLGTVKSRIRLALNRLRAILDSDL
ncbi:sigma-70 family RNA polymerase sigma factor [Inquilinus sp. CAU 1745]|uniref:sigma-70 family RNA polymerase sigma factor n=1 Tax=Inquilinus sp. CAU 1745 TaxID=3140369 RepID=UPI00325AD16D